MQGPRRLKEVLTTGEVATACGVAMRTVSKWFDAGRIRGYRIPGSEDRRMPRKAVIEFMREVGMPIPQWLGGGAVLTVGCNGLGERLAAALPRDVSLETTDTPFDAGRAYNPTFTRAVVIDVGGLGTTESRELVARLRAAGHTGRIVAVLPEGTGQTLSPLEDGYTDALEVPFPVEALAALVSE